jgi:soluble lytic murein transglycosylase
MLRNFLPFHLRLVCVLVSFSCSVVNAAPMLVTPPQSTLSRDLLAARAAYERRDITVLAEIRTRIPAGSIASSDSTLVSLQHYPTAWWLSAQLAQNATHARSIGSELKKFIADHPDAAISDSLRRDYLRALGKLDAWQEFNDFLPRYQGDDTEVACQRWRASLALSGSGKSASPTLGDVKALWNQHKNAPDACHELFAKLRTNKLISDSDVWARVRTLFGNNQLAEARRSATYASDLPANFEPRSAEANINAKRYLEKVVVPSLRKNDRPQVELALFALTRLARTNAQQAVDWLTAHENRFNDADAKSAWAQMGYLGALQLLPNAHSWYANAKDAPLNDTQAAWLVRAALRAAGAVASTDKHTATQYWQDVRRGIAQMTSEEQRDAAWRYWLARALATSAEAKDQSESRRLYDELAREKNFYGVLAAEEIGHAIVPNFNGYQPAEADVAQARTHSGVRRAFALYQLAQHNPDFRHDALREWQFATRGLSDEQLLAVAEAAKREALPDRAINTAERTKALHDFGQRYPLPHRTALQFSAKQNNLDEAWVFGLIRQESRFITDARSSVGAMGLMQLMPATAKWVAKQKGMKDFSPTKVVDVPINLALGSYYLRHVLDDLGHPVLATAAYNAGPGRARRWRAETPLEGAIYAESIPFNETRDYVKKVMVNKWFYHHRIHGKSPKLAELMGTIPARASARVASNSGATSQLAYNH